MKRKILAAVLVLAMCFAFAGCGGDSGDKDKAKEKPKVTSITGSWECEDIEVTDNGKKVSEDTIKTMFGKDFSRLKIAFTSNLGTNAGVMAMYGLGYPVSIEGAARYWRKDLLIQKKLYPEIYSSTLIAWRRNIPYSRAVQRFIEEIKTFAGADIQ